MAIALFAGSFALTQEATPAGYLIQVDWTHIASPSGYRTCMQVAPDGKYRLEEYPDASNQPRGFAVYEGTLSQPQLEDLKNLLAAPEFASLANSSLPKEGFFTINGDIAGIAVSRPNRTQVLWVLDDERQKKIPPAVRPVLDWVKKARKREGPRLKGQAPLLCNSGKTKPFP